MIFERKLSPAQLLPELEFVTSRSGGPGGQNVNKVNSKVTLRWDVKNSTLITPEEKEFLLNKLATRLTQEGILVMTAQEERSQLQNKEKVLAKFEKLLQLAFIKKTPRKKTKPSKAASQKRLQQKKLHSDKKKRRRGLE